MSRIPTWGAWRGSPFQEAILGIDASTEYFTPADDPTFDWAPYRLRVDAD